MRFAARCSLLAALLTSAIAAVSTSAAQAAFGVEKFEAGTCTTATCTFSEPATFFTQAAGHPPFGVTDFTFNTTGSPPGAAPEGNVKNIRVDLPPGLSVNPLAVPQCTVAQLEASACPPESQVGVDEIFAFAGVDLPPIPVAVYNLVPPPGRPLMTGFTVPIVGGQVFIVGGVSWNTDYHEFFTISEVPTVPALIRSRLIFNGRAEVETATNHPETSFITNPSTCAGPQTTTLFVESHEGQTQTVQSTTPVGVSGCNLVPFEPSLEVKPETTQSDLPDGATVEVKVPHDPNPEHVDSSTLNSAVVTLPEGLTLNPSAAQGLDGCTAAQIGIGSTETVACPAASKIGEVKIETPVLPPGSLKGNVYLGKPESGASITGPPYTIYLDAESERYGVSVRLRGSVVPDESTGRLTTTFAGNPQLPFSDLILSFTRPGLAAPLANPLVCGSATSTSSLAPYTGNPAALPFSTFTVDFNGHGAACPSPLPFALAQGTQVTPTTAGAHSAFTFALTRADGQQYLSKVRATLPAGLVGLIPSLTPCGEPQAAQGACPAGSEIGTATVTAGAGATPTQFAGPVFLTGPTAGAPYGLSIAVPASAGPFSLGTVLVRAKIEIDQRTGRLTVTSQLPSIVKGIPLRLRSVAIAVNRQNFLVNPTNCGLLATDTILTSSPSATTQSLSTPFQVTDCEKLGFKPKFTAIANGRTSRKNGAGLTVKIGYPSGPQANIKSVFVQLPAQLSARLTTLQQACPEATFDANPSSCPSGSFVGSATVKTPVLPTALKGQALFVSHGGAAFPDLDLVLDGGGVRVILVGNTNIKGTITTSNFAAVPDVPISSFELKLPTGPHSALAPNGSLCSRALSMPTTITGQNSAQIKQNTKVAVTGCGVRIAAHKVKGKTALLTVQPPAAGRVSGSGAHVKTVRRTVRSTAKITLKLALSSKGRSALSRHGKLKVKLRVGFVPKQKGPTSKAFVTVTFRR